MDKNKSLFAIYKFDFHKAIQRTIEVEDQNIDDAKYVKIAQTCFASLFFNYVFINFALQSYSTDIG